MRIGIIGLGRMGGNIAVRLTRHGHDVVVHDRTSEVTTSVVGRCEAGRATPADTLADMAKLLEGDEHRVVWVMLPAGAITEDCVQQLGVFWGAATSSLMVAIPTTRTMSAVRPNWLKRAFPMSMSGLQAVSGVWNAVTA